MLNSDLWTTFEKELNAKDIVRLEDRLAFLRDALEDALTQYYVEDIRSELDLNLHIYLNYLELSPDTNLTAWLIHDSWFNYYNDGSELNPELSEILKTIFLQPRVDLHSKISGFLKCLNSNDLIHREADAVVWLSFLDYMASRLICHIGDERMQKLFGGAGESGGPKVES